MCTHLRRITNKYTGEDMFVKCGKCKACQMEKANVRKNRIQSELRDGYIYLFVTLSYDRMSCPYVYLDDIYNKVETLPVYRAHSVRIVPDKDLSGNIIYRERRTYNEVKLFDVVCPDYNDIFCPGLSCLQKFGKRVGVCVYDDLKNFVKRLRINLDRNFHYNEKIKFYACSEYGPKTKRPHFHLLTLIRACDEEIVRNAILKSWPFAYKYRTSKYIEVARNAASYVSTYVNCNSSIHPFLSANFSVKHSYSKHFGFGCELFSLSSVLDMYERRDMSYFIETAGTQPKLSLVPLPKYVINRYFPYFKGAFSLPDSAVQQFILNSASYASVTYRSSLDGCPIMFLSETLLPRLKPVGMYSCEPMISYSPDDLCKIRVRLNNAYTYYHEVTGRNRFDFALDYIGVWRCYKFTCFRLWRSDDSVCEMYLFDNLIDLVNGIVKDSARCDYYDSLIKAGCRLIISPNSFPQNINKDLSLGDLFDKKDKSRKVVNSVMSLNGHYV